MPQAIEFLIIRHCETASNIKGILQGQTEGELNPLGVKQAMAVAEWLHPVHIDACYSSDLHRALDTAEIILAAGHQNLELHPETELREWHLGELESRHQSELIAKYPEIMSAFRHESGEELLVPGGESSFEFHRRIEGCLTRLASLHKPGERILLVTHGAVLGRILQMVTGFIKRGNRIPIPANASISSIAFFPEEKCWELLSWNQTEHLRGIPTHGALTY